jgi:hypothetical protein
LRGMSEQHHVVMSAVAHHKAKIAEAAEKR